MADERQEPIRESAETGARSERPPLTAEQFVATPEFRRLKRGMRKIVKVSKTEIDHRVQRMKKLRRDSSDD